MNKLKFNLHFSQRIPSYDVSHMQFPVFTSQLPPFKHFELFELLLHPMPYNILLAN